MPRTVILNGRKWKCECGAENEVMYDSCSECDEEFEVVDSKDKQAKKSAIKVSLSHAEADWLLGLTQAAYGRQMDDGDLAGNGPNRNQMALDVSTRIRKAMKQQKGTTSK